MEASSQQFKTPVSSTPENNESLSLRVLIAEDTSYIRDELVYSLKLKGYKVVTVVNGQQLIDELRKDPNYDIIITDNNMPTKSGLQALAEIRQEKLTIPAIVLTGDVGDVKSRVESLDAVYMAKPYSDKDLYNTISRLTQFPKSVE